MMSLQYQNLYDLNKSTDKLDAYCRLEGLDPAYIRSMMKAERSRLKSGISGAFGLLYRKRTVREKGAEYKEVLE